MKIIKISIKIYISVIRNMPVPVVSVMSFKIHARNIFLSSFIFIMLFRLNITEEYIRFF